MAIFRKKFTVETRQPAEEAWKKLLAVVKTDGPTCTNCGHIVARQGARFCTSCGQPLSPQPKLSKLLLARAFSSRQGFEFQGSASPRGFHISRIIAYRNCCIPVITGQFQPAGAGTRVVVDMRMHPLGYVLLAAGMWLTFVVPLAIMAGDNGRLPALFALLPLAAPCFIALVCWLAFRVEADIASGALGRIWESAPAAQTRDGAKQAHGAE